MARDAAQHWHCAGRWHGVISLSSGPDGKRVRRKLYAPNRSTRLAISQAR